MKKCTRKQNKNFSSVNDCKNFKILKTQYFKNG